MLVIAVVALATVGLAFTAIPFMSSLRLSETAGSTLPRLRVSDLDEGSYRFFAERDAGFLVLRMHGGSLKVFAVPLSQGKVVMPDLRWGRWGGYCENFAPDAVGGKLAQEGIISCRDPGLSEWSKREWRWTYAGRNLGTQTEDMKSVPFVQEGSDVVPGKRER